MAHYTKIQLKDEKTRKFLESKGFINVDSCSRNSCWRFSQYNVHMFVLNHNPLPSPIYLNTKAKIHCDEDLYFLFYKLGIQRGRKEAKEEIWKSIMECVNTLIFKNIYTIFKSDSEIKKVDDEDDKGYC